MSPVNPLLPSWVSTPGEREVCDHGMHGDGILTHLGFRATQRDAAQVAVEVDCRKDLNNHAGMVQGGVIATLVDVVAGVATARKARSNKTFTSDMTMHFLAPGRVGPVRAEARVVRLGRHSAVTEVVVFDTGADDRLMTLGTVSFALPPERD